jgi:hypothetical protein
MKRSGIDRRRVMRVAALALFVPTSCIRQGAAPERVFVPGKSFKHSVEVRTQQGDTAIVHVGEWLSLSASRSTGPWIEVDRESLGPEGCWVAPPPSGVEDEVADNVTWSTEPKGVAEFNLGLLPDHGRRVRFSKPGPVVLRAMSATYCSLPARSNELTVMVKE